MGDLFSNVVVNKIVHTNGNYRSVREIEVTQDGQREEGSLLETAAAAESMREEEMGGHSVLCIKSGELWAWCASAVKDKGLYITFVKKKQLIEDFS